MIPITWATVRVFIQGAVTAPVIPPPPPPAACAGLRLALPHLPSQLLVADLDGEEPTRRAVGALREELAELSGQLDAAELRAARLPHREKYLLLVIEFLRGLLQLHLDWIETVEERLAAEPTKR